MKLSSSTCLLLSAAYWMDIARDYVRLALIDSACRNTWLITARSSAANARRLAAVWSKSTVAA